MAQVAVEGGDDASFAPSVSADGRYVVFNSDADNLSDEDFNVFRNAFLRDMVTGTTSLISRRSVKDGNGAADGNAYSASISPNGRYVAFSSDADNLSGEVRDIYRHIFVRDLYTGTTTLASRADGPGGALGNDDSLAPTISDNGVVAFWSAADNLSTADTNANNDDIFVRSVTSSSTALVSRADGAGGEAGDGDAPGGEYPSISSDGTKVAFVSNANNLTTAGNDLYRNVFVRDLGAGTTILASRQSAADGGAGADGDSRSPSISDTGAVAFSSTAPNLSSEDNDPQSDVFMRDLTTDTTTLVSRQSASDGGLAGDERSELAVISRDGMTVGFRSIANNLSTADNDAFINVYIRDLPGSTTLLVSRQSASDGGAGGDRDSSFSGPIAISSDGRYVAFDSGATNLSAIDFDPVLDIFRRDVQTETTELVSQGAVSRPMALPTLQGALTPTTPPPTTRKKCKRKKAHSVAAKKCRKKR